MEQEGLVTISVACRVLGVSETALRQWTDEGRVKAFVTPGGHRRYLLADLNKFMGFPHGEVSFEDLAAELEHTALSLRQIGITVIGNSALQGRLSAEAMEELSSLGRSLLDSIVKYTIPSESEEALRAARSIGENLGISLAKLGLPLTDSVEAFIMHRSPLMEAAVGLMKKRESLTGRMVETIPMVAHVMDEALVSLVAAHQHYKSEEPYQAMKDDGQ